MDYNLYIFDYSTIIVTLLSDIRSKFSQGIPKTSANITKPEQAPLVAVFVSALLVRDTCFHYSIEYVNKPVSKTLRRNTE